MSRLGRLITLAAVTLVAPPALVGCPKNTCFLKVCTNGKCSCPVSSCVDGAEYDTGRNTCVCSASRIPLAGQCLTQQAANAYCGKGNAYGKNGCEAIQCLAGHAYDEASNRCVAESEVASRVGVAVGEGEKLGCPPGSKLVVEGSSAACVPLESSCAADEQWDGTRCTKMGTCGAGASWDPEKGACVQFAVGADDTTVVDVASWTASNYGQDGGRGQSSFCNKFARKPWRFGVPQGQTATVEIHLSLAFPERVVANSRVGSAASFVGVNAPMPAGGSEAVQSAAEEILTALKQGGGRANNTETETRVRCAVRNASKPVAVPATGGV